MARQDRVSQLIQMLNDAITNDDMDLASEIRSDLYREFQLKMSNGGKVKIPQLSTDVANISDVYEAIDDPSYVRDTTKIKNLQKGSKVTRKMGYNKIFETFEKKGISKATIQKFKNVPKITDFDNAKDFSNALKKFRETAFKGLNTKQINVIRSSGFLSNYAKDVRSALPKFGQGADRRMLNKALDDTFDYVFETLKTAEGVKKT
jgi:SOS response regulatory protein OraA/RecX